MKKSELIREYIKLYKPTHKQLQTFCKYCLSFKESATLDFRAKYCNKMSEKHSHKRLGTSGYYSNNIETWLFNRVVQKKDKRYCLTPRAIRKGWSLYSNPLEVQVERLKFCVEQYRKLQHKTHNQYRESQKELERAKEIINDLGIFLDNFETLTRHYDRIKTKYDIEI